MLKLMIVDDNKLALEYFSQLLKWEKYGYELVCTAIDGESALFEFEKLRPDVVITDIQMPNMDGIELTRRIQQIAPNTVIIFLSSYEEFSYIHDAMHLGVYDYILKHETKEKELGEKLLHIKEFLENRRRKNRYIAEGDFACFLNDYSKMSEQSRSRFFRGFPERYDLYVAYQDHILPVIEQLLAVSTDELPENEIKTFFYGFPETEAVLKKEPYTYLILARSKEDLVDDCYWKKEQFFRSFHQELSILIVAENQHIVGCLEKYQDTRPFFTQKYFYPASTILYPDMLKKIPAQETVWQHRELSAMLEENRFRELCCQMDQEYRQILNSRNYRNFEQVTRDYLLALLPYHQQLPDLRTRSLFYVYNEASSTFWYDVPSVFGWLKERCSVLSHILSSDSQYHYSPAVQKAILYIYRNYKNGELSAEEIAEYANININRLNFVMKRETGCTVWKMLIQIRMETAKELLDSTDLKVNDISEQVGYKSLSHFSNVFKKYFGLSAQEYRRRQKNENI